MSAIARIHTFRLARTWLACLLLALSAGAARAGVSEIDGSFSLSVVDVASGHDMESAWRRTYNSQNEHKGWFGWGWSTELETRVIPAENGDIAVVEHGKEHRFQPTSETVALADRPVGARWTRDCCGIEHITRLTRGYLRETCNRTQFFDPSGRLERIEDDKGNYILFTYATEGRRIEAEDKHGYRLRATFGPDGTIQKLADSAGRKASYRYSAAGELVQADAIDGRHIYAYDASHRMVRAEHPRAGVQTVGYVVEGGVSKVARIEFRGRRTDYAYQTAPADPLHLTVTATSSRAADDRKSVQTHDFYRARRANGDTYLARQVVIDDGDDSETVYAEVGSFPLRVLEAGQETRYSYDDQWRVTEKDTPAVTHHFTYHPTRNKVTRVELIPKPAGDAVRFEYRYDDRGELLEAVSSDGRRVTLEYNTDHRIARVTVAPNHYAAYEYGEDGRPITIRYGKEGAIRISYGASGEVNVSRNPAGRKVALNVAAVMADLMDLVRPAGTGR